MAADDPVRQHQLDETSCGPLCQHPQCWASNRRTERGLPHLKDPASRSWNPSENEGALPTLKVQNLLADCGLALSHKGSHLTQQTGCHHRSASASAVEGCSREKHGFPSAPHTSPFDAISSAQSSPFSLATKAKSVEVREVFDLEELNSDWQKAFVPSQVYVWCPSKKSYERRLRKDQENAAETIEQSDVAKPVTVKDLTDVMVPKIPKERAKRSKKIKKKLSRVTPTGGRPYTHPSRSPVPRKTMPTDVDESVARLLTLPRDILMDVLVHIQNSKSLDKQKVQILLTRLMPLIHFDQNQPPHRALSPTPLLASGILQNKKIDLLPGLQQGHHTEHLPLGITGVAAENQTRQILDDGLVSAMTTSMYSALTQQIPTKENGAAKELHDHLGRMAHKQLLGPIQADSTKPRVSVLPVLNRNKLTSVSTKSLPPLVPGSKPTKPFDYKATKSLDLTLGPLSTPEHLSPDKPSSPRSDKPSTVYVTLPSMPSPDRTAATTPLQPYGRPSPHPGMHERLLHHYLRDTPSPIASEDFHPLHSVSPSLSTGVPRTPLGTPATFINQSFKPAPGSHQKPSRSPSPSKQTLEGIVRPLLNTALSPTAEMIHNLDVLGTIQEVHSELVTSYPDSSASDINHPISPSKQFAMRFSDLQDGCTSVEAVVHSDRASWSPVQRGATPQHATATPEPWPVVDERDFMTSPDGPNEMTSNQILNMATPMAPPPSPEPAEPKNEFDFDVNNASQTRMVSLTPLTEGEEECNSENYVSEEEKDLREALTTEIWKDEPENKLPVADVQRDKDTELDNGTKIQLFSNNPSQMKDEIPAENATANESRVENDLENEITKERTSSGLPSTEPVLAEPLIIGNNHLKESDQTNAELPMKAGGTPDGREMEDQISIPTAVPSDQKENPKSDKTLQESNDDLPKADSEPEKESKLQPLQENLRFDLPAFSEITEPTSVSEDTVCDEFHCFIISDSGTNGKTQSSKVDLPPKSGDSPIQIEETGTEGISSETVRQDTGSTGDPVD